MGRLRSLIGSLRITFDILFLLPGRIGTSIYVWQSIAIIALLVPALEFHLSYWLMGMLHFCQGCLFLLMIHQLPLLLFYPVLVSLLLGLLLTYSMFSNAIRLLLIVIAIMLSFRLVIWFTSGYALHVITLFRVMLLLRSLHHAIMGLTVSWIASALLHTITIA
ncbi:hypothetical protein O6H91_11G083600 [Diphasiastrum complanatum]|uniref:Uncharacterized protein n=1 Tax=Diphasiastrum complanatum TaxID=34168 RepID=A0ACC2CBD4_DIPCM|nr:hypothetical protein O6H91_11G083600 [Diphasiastrum complanatum]